MYLHVIWLARRGDGAGVFLRHRDAAHALRREADSLRAFLLAREGISAEKAHVTASVLVVAILVIDATAYRLMNRFMRKYR